MEGYTLLEYIESDGTQYIDTGFKPNQDTRVVMDCILNTGNTYLTAFGTVDSTGTAKYTLLALNSSQIRHYYGNKETDYNYSLLGVRHLIDMDKEVLTIDNNRILTGAVSTFSCKNNLLLLSYDGGVTFTSYGKIYSCQIYDNGTLVRDYIPCMNTEGVYGLYDKVNGVFYASATDSGFTGKWAENKTLNVSMSEYRHRMMNLIPKTGLPKGYFRCEYIESDGTNFIDTGFKPNNNTRVTCDFEFMTTPSKTMALFGARTSASSKNYAFLYASSTGKLRSDYNKSYNQEFDYITGRFQIDKNKETTTISGESKSYTNDSFSSSYNLYLFALNQADTAQWYATARIYSCQIYDNGTLVRDYIPCVNPEGYFGLYDLVTDEFYGLVQQKASRSYTVNLGIAGNWTKGGFTNPDSSKYDAYMSNSSKGVGNAYDIMRITINGYDEFTCYIRSYAESLYDYAVIGHLDKTLSIDTIAGSSEVKAHTSSNQQSGTGINSYTKVVYTGIGGGTHFIDVMYRKDSSDNYGDDRGYLLIDKSTVSSGGTIQVIGRGKVILPSGYINAEYIEGDGNAWVDSGYFPNGNTKVVMDAQMISYSSGLPAFFGAFGTSNKNSFAFLDPAEGSNYYAYYYGSSETTNNKITAGMFDRGIIITDKGTANYHGTIVSLADASFTSTNTLYLFCGNENGILKYNASMRLYQCQIHDNGTFTKFFIPCSKDGVFGLYEMFEGIFYSSEGSSEFTGESDGDNEGSGGDDVVTISFGIGGVEYQAEEGMTWSKWIDSKFNTDGYFIEASGNYIADASGNYIGLDGVFVRPSEVIQEGTSYLLV